MPGRVLTQVRAQLVYHALSVMRSRHASRAAGRARRVSAMSESIRPFIRGLHAYSAWCAGGARASLRRRGWAREANGRAEFQGLRRAFAGGGVLPCSFPPSRWG
jgi:hypothetical protein